MGPPCGHRRGRRRRDRGTRPAPRGSRGRRSTTVTAAWVPEGLEWVAFNAAMRAKGLVIAGGQGQWAGRILRFGHMGEVVIGELADAMRTMAETLAELGRPADGAAAAAAVRDAYDAALASAAR